MARWWEENQWLKAYLQKAADETEKAVQELGMAMLSAPKDRIDALRLQAHTLTGQYGAITAVLGIEEVPDDK